MAAYSLCLHLAAVIDCLLVPGGEQGAVPPPGQMNRQPHCMWEWRRATGLEGFWEEMYWSLVPARSSDPFWP